MIYPPPRPEKRPRAPGCPVRSGPRLAERPTPLLSRPGTARDSALRSRRRTAAPVGPVYIHAARCEGYTPTGRLPDQLAIGPRVLRTYRADDTMNYEHNTVVTDEADLQPIIERLLGKPDVATVHVRTLAPQCFLYAVAAD